MLNLKIILIATIVVVVNACNQEPPPPNILFCISDDQSWAHTSFAGTRELNTPAFDQVAANGIYFENAYTAAPSCAPSRAAIFTGQDIYRLEEGGLLFGALLNKFPVFTHMLRENGYEIGLYRQRICSGKNGYGELLSKSAW
ncbi:MAG: sulfatase-like hydrolase/transferase [Cyclobacteriaceae bacterium]